MESLYLIGLAVLAVFAFVLAIVLFNFFGLWLRARIANAPVASAKWSDAAAQGAGGTNCR
jgi:hypothetical protein